MAKAKRKNLLQTIDELRWDIWLASSAIGLVLFGVVMVYSSSSVVALTNYNDPAYFVKRQILWMVIGFALMAITMHTDHRALADRRAVVGP